MADALADEDRSDYRNGDFFNCVSEHMRDWLDYLDASTVPWATAPVGG